MVPDLRLTGTMSDAGLAGSIAIVDDGRIRVSGRSYRLRESAIVFTPEQGLVPRLNVFGETRIGDYDVTLRLSGPADAIETSLSSNPPLSDRDLQSLVVTGQTAGLTGETANSDAFAVGAVSGDVLGFAGQFVGLDSVRVGSSDDLELVSSDVEPSTRLTVSKRFGQRFELVLSENLDDSELTWSSSIAHDRATRCDSPRAKARRTPWNSDRKSPSGQASAPARRCSSGESA